MNEEKGLLPERDRFYFQLSDGAASPIDSAPEENRK